MLDKPQSCNGCSLVELGKGFSQVEGTGAVPLLIVGESLGYNEYLEGLPFRPQAPAGSILQRVLNKARINRSQILLYNIVACMPPQNKLLGQSYEYSAVNHCRVHFDRLIDTYKPRAILACGNLPLKHLTGLTGNRLSAHATRGFVFKSRYDIPVIPTYHPSFVMRGNLNLMSILLHDVMKAYNIAKGLLVEDRDFFLDPLMKNFDMSSNQILYNTKPNVAEALAFLEEAKSNPNTLITYDIETDKSTEEEEDELEEFGSKLTQIQFSLDLDSGIAFPIEEPFYTISKQILALPNPKAGHNVWDFDNLILEKEGFKIEGRVDDTMWMQHHFQADIPIGLQYTASFYGFPFAWKHMAGDNLPFYGIADVTSVQYIMKHLPNKLRERGLWEGYDKYVHGLKPILVAMSKRGLPINIEEQNKFGKEIDDRKEEVLEEIKPYIQDDLLKYKVYQREPKEIEKAKVKYYISQGTTNVEVPIEYIEEHSGFHLRRIKQEKKQVVELASMGVVFDEKAKWEIVERWCNELGFNPNSPDQISDFIKKNGHEKIARDLALKIAKEKAEEEGEVKNGKNNVSTSKAVLKKLGEKTGNKAYSLIVEYKELTKMKGAFIDGWKPEQKMKDCPICTVYLAPIYSVCPKCGGEKKVISNIGRIHSTFTFRPASGQLSSKNPNIQQGPVHSKLAQRFKRVIEADEGYLLVNIDYKSYHALLLGFLAESPDYMRLAGLDIHSYVAAHMVRYDGVERCLELEDDDLRRFLKKVKSEHEYVRNNQAKQSILGIGFGLSENGCYERYKDNFNPTVEEVLVGKRKVYEGEALQKLIEAEGRRRVKALYALLKKLFPAVFRWQERTVMLADRQGYIDTPFGARRWFNAATDIKYDKFGNTLTIKKGLEAEQALAFPVSNNAHYHMREGMIMMEQEGLLEEARLVNMIHDSLVFEMPEKRLEELYDRIVMIMERESDKILDSKGNKFRCMTDAKVGKNLAEMKEW